MGNVLAPGLVPLLTVAEKEKMLSPASASPCVASSKNCCVEKPPIGLRLATTASPVLVGFDPGVTDTVSSEVEPASTLLGFAAPTPTGGVEDGVTVKAME